MGIFGRLLRGIHAGEHRMSWNDPAASNAPASLVVTSAAFLNNAPIPQRHAGAGVGDNISPPLAWSGVPANAAELILIIEDPGAPTPRPMVHFAVRIAAHVTSVGEGRLSNMSDQWGADVLQPARNTFGKAQYAGPRPIPSHGPHTYVFQIFALDRALDFAAPPAKKDLLKAMRGHVLARGRLNGTYEVA